MSMLRTLSRRDQITDIVHLHSAPTESDVMFAAELAELATQRTAATGCGCARRATQGRLDLSRLDDEVPDWRDRQTWACGPEGMLNARRATCGRRRASPSGCTWSGSRCPARPRTGRAARWTFARSGKTVTVDAATSLMDAGEQAGVQMPFGCRMGICQSCVVGLVDGHVRDLRTGVEHEPGSRVQTCISAASGDCVLDV